MCQSLKIHANSTLHTLYSKLDQVCDVKPPVIPDHTTEQTTEPAKYSSTEAGECVEYEASKKTLEDCSESVMDLIENFSFADWRNDDKVDLICK